MAKSQKQTGYDISLKHFIPADMGDLGALKVLQGWAQEIEKLTGARLVIMPARR